MVDIDAWSYRTRSPCDVLGSAEVKKCKYLQACYNQRATFTPLCVSVGGILGSEAEFVVEMGECLTARCERPYSIVMGWVRALLSFAILWVTYTLLCMCGSLTNWKNLGIVDDASLPTTATD